ncbi:unnamed protein product [Trichobilharzia regenti]|nr:unnamed protein product [Trichobilharzia regenti]
MPEIIPLLVLGLDSSDSDQRRGVCTGLIEIIRSCQRDLLSNYADSLLDPIRRTLCDPLVEVRRNGAKTFELLYGAIGVRSLDGVLPDLLAQLDDPETSQYALDGLKQLLTVKGRAVMPYLVPKLTSPVVNVKAFAYLASVAGEALTKQLGRILPALLQTVSLMSKSENQEGEEESGNDRWNPEMITSQISDLRQGIRGAISEMNKSSSANKTESQKYLPGFSDPTLPLVSLVKLYAECTLRGRPAVKEPAAQGLSECIIYANGIALQGCVIKVIGPLIRLLGERQTNVVRVAVVQSLTSLVNKCPQSVRPFVTQLQATFLKCLGDSHRPMRLLGGEGLSSVVPITPKLDPLLIDLARVSSQTVISRFHDHLKDASKDLENVPASSGASATAHTLAGIATYP